MSNISVSPFKTWKFTIPVLLILTLLSIDQCIKIYVKSHFMLGEILPIFGDWFKIYFIENDGMAYGMKLFGGGKVGKLILTLFRIIVSFVGFWCLIKSIKNNAHWGLLLSLSLVLAGALGNIIDSVFYGVIYAAENQYIGGWFEGQVVDMFYAPLWEGHLPEWLPLWGGQFFVFFSPIWNFADACITVGVAVMIVGQNSFFSKDSIELAFGSSKPAQPEVSNVEETPTESTEETPNNNPSDSPQ